MSTLGYLGLLAADLVIALCARVPADAPAGVILQAEGLPRYRRRSDALQLANTLYCAGLEPDLARELAALAAASADLARPRLGDRPRP